MKLGPIPEWLPGRWKLFLSSSEIEDPRLVERWSEEFNLIGRSTKEETYTFHWNFSECPFCRLHAYTSVCFSSLRYLKKKKNWVVSFFSTSYWGPRINPVPIFVPLPPLPQMKKNTSLLSCFFLPLFPHLGHFLFSSTSRRSSIHSSIVGFWSKWLWIPGISELKIC